jgi:hypothetical protein
MRIFCLPGNSPSTYQWLVNLTTTLDLGQSSVEIQKYPWWEDEDKGIDVPGETEKARTVAADLVIAKSLGTVIALEAYQNVEHTCRFVFLGTPVSMYTDEYRKLLKAHVDSADILLIQQTDDPTGTAADLRAVLPDRVHGSIAEIPGDDHAYLDIPTLTGLIETWYNG